jgi:hypothetical protein
MIACRRMLARFGLRPTLVSTLQPTAFACQRSQADASACWHASFAGL